MSDTKSYAMQTCESFASPLAPFLKHPGYTHDYTTSYHLVSLIPFEKDLEEM